MSSIWLPRIRLNGWQRIGVVLSFVWVVCVGGEYWNETVQGPLSNRWVTDTIVAREPIANLYLLLFDQVMNGVDYGEWVRNDGKPIDDDEWTPIDAMLDRIAEKGPGNG